MLKKIINPWRNHPEYNCFGCCPENPIGLHMEFYEDGDYIVSKWHPERKELSRMGEYNARRHTEYTDR